MIQPVKKKKNKKKGGNSGGGTSEGNNIPASPESAPSETGSASGFIVNGR